MNRDVAHARVLHIVSKKTGYKGIYCGGKRVFDSIHEFLKTLCKQCIFLKSESAELRALSSTDRQGRSSSDGEF